MQRFRNVLVVVDERTENKAVIERAVILAQRNQAHLTLVNPIGDLPRQAPRSATPPPQLDADVPSIDIIEEWPTDADPPVIPESSALPHKSLGELPDRVETPLAEAAVVIREQIVEEQSQRLEQWVDFVRRSGVTVDSKMLYGTPFLEIIREVLRNEHDLVMITAEGRGGLKERLSGTTVMQLMRKCPCPVWAVRPTQLERYTHILAAVDPASQDEGQYAVNIKIMDLATALARRDECELIIVHTWTSPAEQFLRSGYLVASSEIDKWVRQDQDLHRRRLAELLKLYPLQELKSQAYMLKGEPGYFISRLAAKLEVGLIVMGTLNRTGVAGLFMGHTAERILRQVGCSVLTVKPDGFVTPVKLDE